MAFQKKKLVQNFSDDSADDLLLFVFCSLVFLLLSRLCVLQPGSVIVVGCYNRFTYISTLSWFTFQSGSMHSLCFLQVRLAFSKLQCMVKTHGSKSSLYLQYQTNVNCSLKGMRFIFVNIMRDLFVREIVSLNTNEVAYAHPTYEEQGTWLCFFVLLFRQVAVSLLTKTGKMLTKQEYFHLDQFLEKLPLSEQCSEIWGDRVLCAISMVQG